MTEEELAARLEKIQRLFEGAQTSGEREAAATARDRVQARLDAFPREEVVEEYKFSLQDIWSRKLFIALLRKYGYTPYRYRRQRRTTVMARLPQAFVDGTLWPEYLELDRVLSEYIAEVTERVIQNHIYADASEAEEQEELFDLEG